MGRLELERVPDRRHSWLPGISETVGLAAAGGVHAGDYIRDWLATELDKLGVATFGDLRRRDADDDENLPADQRYGLVVTATDVTHGRLLRLPWDYHRFNLDPDEQPVADAVRMSLSIPFFFEPCTLTDARTGERSTIVDGGVLSNFAVEIFDRTDGRPARWSTIGVRLFPDLPAGLDDVVPAVVSPFVPPLHLLRQVVATALVGRDQTQLDRPGVRERTIGVDTSGAGITEFGLDEAGQQLMRDRGRDAVEAFLQTWEAGT
jgi:NTE family protein